MPVWVSNFASPHLINPDEASLGPKVGLIFGGPGFLCWIWAMYRVPEIQAMTYVELAYLRQQHKAQDIRAGDYEAKRGTREDWRYR